MRYFLSLFFVLFGLRVLSQWNVTTVEDFKNQLKLSEKIMGNQGNYSYRSLFSFYETFDSEIPALKYEGNLISEYGKNIYLEQYGQIIVQDRNLNITIDTAYKSIAIQKSIPAYFYPRTSEDFQALSESNVVVKTNLSTNGKKFSLEFPKGGKYLGCELWFNEKNYLIKYIMYASQEIDNSNDIYESNYIQPKLEITFFDFQFGTQVNLTKMRKVKDFLTITGDKMVPVQEYADYQLQDLRIEINE